mmetsp:Transcript_125701/g.314149  ORF Transcript_125701/g.314149 Transcript_125701/m.314149 type:complete len:257 (+) Transcript_125701:210-980(+)
MCRARHVVLRSARTSPGTPPASSAGPVATGPGPALKRTMPNNVPMEASPTGGDTTFPSKTNSRTCTTTPVHARKTEHEEAAIFPNAMIWSENANERKRASSHAGSRMRLPRARLRTSTGSATVDAMAKRRMSAAAGDRPVDCNDFSNGMFPPHNMAKTMRKSGAVALFSTAPGAGPAPPSELSELFSAGMCAMSLWLPYRPATRVPQSALASRLFGAMDKCSPCALRASEAGRLCQRGETKTKPMSKAVQAGRRRW